MTIQQNIEQKLNSEFEPVFLQVENESHMHNVPKDSESHFKVVLVTTKFSGLNKVKQHQAVYKVLTEELSGEVHALALHTYDPKAWADSQGAPSSPNCMGGTGK
ncbi:BolA/IbaG family iron-sulfur metabolism protein [Oceaniserpentilla sp. 4NH20-0058]|uniref:BolA/IbaG family iron-sulfur metabolism protein n=1 Tax=Oceaniserpentilla sp. 4NH20-0058 TaxID=3127660 RepID=UPI003105A558